MRMPKSDILEELASKVRGDVLTEMADSKEVLDAGVAWARSGWATLLDGTASGGGYLNFDSAGDDDQRVVASMSSDSLVQKSERLRDLKRRLDPENLFKLKSQRQACRAGLVE